jgi:hypothetical protein
MEGGNYGSAPFTFGTLAPLPERKATSAGGGSKAATWVTGGVKLHLQVHLKHIYTMVLVGQLQVL